MVFINSIIAFVTAFLSTFLSILPFDFEGLAPWIADVAPTQNATIIASPPVLLSPWTNTETYINQSALIVSISFAAAAVPYAAAQSTVVSSSPAVPLSLLRLSTSAHQPPDETLKGPSFSEQLYRLCSLLQRAIFRAILAVNDFLARHNPIRLVKQRVSLSRIGNLSDDETPRGKQSTRFRILRAARLRRQRKRYHQ
jgi:hypothetical protein